MTAPATQSRTHIVLVPGFVGFDALGQLIYYSGTTGVFRRWARHQAATLHYFDNLPTYRVARRGHRLVQFLVKLVARGEIGELDHIALVGHSTGGLDIRAALAELQQDAGELVDGGVRVPYREVRARIDRACFLSTPQYGANIADLVRPLGLLVQPLARLGARLSPWRTRHLLPLLAGLLPPGETGLRLALQEALEESRYLEGGHDLDPAVRKARSDLRLWLEHIGTDFGVIEDLRSARPGLDEDHSTSPAHRSPAARRAEIASWGGLHTLSVASYVPDSDQGFWSDKAARRVLSSRLAGPLARRLPAETRARLARLAQRVPNAEYGLAEHLSAGLLGRFDHPTITHGDDAIADTVELLDSPGQVWPTHSLPTRLNDGVVNTLSMLWPVDRAAPARHRHLLVEADHAQVIGHYENRPRPDAGETGRRHDAYALFDAPTGFDGDRFERLWTTIFDFCLGQEQPARQQLDEGAGEDESLHWTRAVRAPAASVPFPR